MKINQNDKLRKEKTTVYVSKDCLKKCDSSLILTGARSQSEFFEQVIHSVNKVKRLNGTIKLEDSVKYHSEN